jgi:hypothetical protein
MQISVDKIDDDEYFKAFCFVKSKGRNISLEVRDLISQLSKKYDENFMKK